MRHEIIPSTHTLSKYEKKIGNPYSSQWTFYRHVFARRCYVLQIFRNRACGGLS